MILKDSCSLEKSSNKPRLCIRKQIHHFADKNQYTQSCDFSTHGCDSWIIKKAEYLRTAAFKL